VALLRRRLWPSATELRFLSRKGSLLGLLTRPSPENDGAKLLHHQDGEIKLGPYRLLSFVRGDFGTRDWSEAVLDYPPSNVYPRLVPSETNKHILRAEVYTLK
jgi:hypothetical protein